MKQSHMSFSTVWRNTNIPRALFAGVAVEIALGDFNRKRCNFHGRYAQGDLFTDGTPKKV